jgi:nucleoid-associated protein YgaU
MRSWSLVLGVVGLLALAQGAVAEDGGASAAAPLEQAAAPTPGQPGQEAARAASDAQGAGSGAPAALDAAASDEAPEPTAAAADDEAPEPTAAADDEGAGAAEATAAAEEPESPELEPASAEEAAPEAAAQEGDQAAPATASDESAAAPSESAAAPAAPAATASRHHQVVLGPIGYDDQGREGRIHTVARGDTLWDISAAYLGTPWVWPSVWIENAEIANPHRIYPGDLIWITDNEMRRVSRAEADRLLAGEPAAPDEGLAFETPEAGEGAPPAAQPEPIALDRMPVSVPLQGTGETHHGRVVRVTNREFMSFVSSETLAAASSIVESPEEKVWLAQGDAIYLGLGEGEVEVGDQFTLFRDVDEVRDISNESLLGYHVHVLGWAEVKEVHRETAIATIRASVAEIHRGDRVVPREAPAPEVTVREAPEGIFGRVVFMPDHRTEMGSADYVYLNVGSIHGLEVGTALQVYEPGHVTTDWVRRTTVKTPDHPLAELVVVALKPDSCVAYVTRANAEIEVGQPVKGEGPI